MLRVFSARENTDKDRFLFSEIGKFLSGNNGVRRRLTQSGDLRPDGRGEGAARVLLIVPEQFTLQAEQSAFAYLNIPGFMDLDVLSMTSLGRRIYDELGGGDEPFISKYGKFMLLSRLLYAHRDDMESFRGLEGSPKFISRLNDMITELKNFGVDAAALAEICGSLGGESLLTHKLADVQRIYADYEAALGETYVDAAGYLKNVTACISRSRFVAESVVWIWGFDYLSPALMDAVTELARQAVDVNFLMTGDPALPFFSLANELTEELLARARAAGVEAAAQVVPREAFPRELPAEILQLEADFCGARDAGAGPSADGTDVPAPGSVRLMAAANFYEEAAQAAEEACRLIRDEGYRYSDILLLCNDMKVRAPIIERVFADYGLPVFMDIRRQTGHNPLLEFILLLPEVTASGRSLQTVFRLLKTGLTSVPRESWEPLEKYAKRYRIRGSQWRREFTWGEEDDLAAHNEARREIDALLSAFEDAYKESDTAAEKTDSLYRFLTVDARLPEAAERMAAALEEAGELEAAAQMRGIWNVVKEVFVQMKTVLGARPMSRAEYALVLRTGFESVNLGMLPPSRDQIVMGTMQRTRTGQAKVVFVLGANDGVLPASEADDDILSGDEKLRMEQRGHFLGRRDETVYLEEQLAIYRNLAKATQRLIMSYAASDTEGKDLRPSAIYERLTELFPGAEQGAVASGALARVQSPEQALAQLARALPELAESAADLTAPEAQVWQDVYLWFSASPAYKQRLGNLRAGMLFAGRHARVDARFIEALYSKRPAAEDCQVDLLDSGELRNPVIETSPSAVERYSRCAFSWFLQQGLRLEEDRVFEIDTRFTGDVFHNVLMQYGEKLDASAGSPEDVDSLWQKISQEEAQEITGQIFTGAVESFQGGLFRKGPFESYRASRMQRIAAEATWAVTEQVRSGSVEKMLFETDFRAGGVFPPILARLPEGQVSVRGRIDRLDVLRGGNARIIDYKSGADKFSREDVLAGWQMQLFTYLQAVSGRYTPAGVFYFPVREPRAEDKADGKTAATLKKKFKPEGVALAVYRELMGEGAATVDGPAFAEMQARIRERIDEVSAGMLAGRIDAAPMRSKKLKSRRGGLRTACDYCRYKGICNYEETYI